MYTPTDSEAREWRRCSLLGLGVLLLSVTGEMVVNAHEDHAGPRKAGSWRCMMEAPARSWSLLNYFVAPLSR
jgi:hypothetical protein